MAQKRLTDGLSRAKLIATGLDRSADVYAAGGASVSECFSCLVYLSQGEQTMTRRKSIFGALFISAVCFVAFGVSSAAASTIEECKKPVAGEVFTAQFYKDAECKTKDAKGEFATVRVEPTSLLKATNTTTFELSANVVGVETQITCETMAGTATTENFEAGGVMKFKGEGKTEFSKCKVDKPAGCTVAEPIKTVQLTATSEDLPSEVMRTLYTPKEGTTFTTITLGNCGLLNGPKNVQGKARSQTVNVESEEFSSTSGSELTFAGFTATLNGKLHYATDADGKTVARETP